jgi:hypothetical protein
MIIIHFKVIYQVNYHLIIHNNSKILNIKIHFKIYKVLIHSYIKHLNKLKYKHLNIL